MSLSLKQKIIASIVAFGLILIAIFNKGLALKNEAPANTSPQTKPQVQTNTPELISTNPQALDGTTILPTQIIELNFNLPLENDAEIKITFEPKAEYKIELSNDKKTAKIIPLKPYALGQGYSLSIKSDTKFQGKKTLGRDYGFGFRTIEYRGV